MEVHTITGTAPWGGATWRGSTGGRRTLRPGGGRQGPCLLCSRPRAWSWRSSRARPGGRAERPLAEVVRIGGLREQPDGAYLVIAAPPVSQSGTPLAADDFAVTVDGEEVASEARPRDPADLTVAIVVQAGVSAEDLEVEKDAATETLLALPDVARTIVITSGTEPKVLAPAGTDRRAAADGDRRGHPGTRRDCGQRARPRRGPARGRPAEGDPPVRSGGVRDAGRDPRRSGPGWSTNRLRCTRWA